MASIHASLDAASVERKARLAKLKSLKRKQSENETNGVELSDSSLDSSTLTSSLPVTINHLSGRNYDPISRGPKLGFETLPNQNQETLEDRAEEIANETHRQAEQNEKDEKPIDLFRLQPKKPNWDLKRDVGRKMERLNLRTENAIARMVRERIEGAKRKAQGNGEGEELGLKGEELVEGVHAREREEAEEERREDEDEDMV